MKKFLIQEIIFILLLCSGVVKADYKYEDDFNYVIIDGEIEITGCMSTEEVIIVPEEIDGLPVTRIWEYAFSFCENEKEIVLPDSIKEIGEVAFANNYMLEKINLPKELKTIPNSCFYGCYNLKEITIPEGVTKIGASAFEGCTKLSTINIPTSLTEIEENVFKGCTGLKKIDIEDIASYLNIDYKNREACPAYFASEIYLDGEELTELTVPDTVKEIPHYGFYKCDSLKNIKIPDSVTKIGYYAFFGCDGITDIPLSGGPLVIQDYAFSRCSGLTDITLENVTEIGRGAFEYCVNLANVQISGEAKTIKEDAFNDCLKLTDVVISDNVTTIGRDAFLNTPLLNDSSNWENSALYIGKHLIKVGDVSGEYTIKDGTVTIATRALEECNSMTDAVIPNSVQNINQYAFYKCNNLKNVVIGTGVRTILSHTFYNCPLIETISIQRNIRNIKYQAFYKSTAVKNIKYYGSESEWEKVTIDVMNDNLVNASKYYLPVSIRTEKSVNEYIVIPTNVPKKSSIVFVCYKDGKPVYIETYVYGDEEKLIFRSDIKYDRIKIFVWSDFKNCLPLCSPESI